MDLKTLKNYVSGAKGFLEHRERLKAGLELYAEEAGDKDLKRAVYERYHKGKKTPWGGDKVIEFTIGFDKLVVDREARTMKGPENIVQNIKEANERWRGVRDEKYNTDSYWDQCRYAPPGDLWNFDALVPLVFRVYGDGVKWRTVETYPDDPLDRIYAELGYERSVAY